MTGNGLYMPPIYFVKLGMIYEIVLLTLMSLILNIIVLLTLITHFTIVFLLFLIIIWLVVYLPIWKMMHFVSWDDIPFPIPNCFWKVIQNSMVPVTNQIGKWIKFASYEYHSGVTNPRIPQVPSGCPVAFMAAWPPTCESWDSQNRVGRLSESGWDLLMEKP